MMCESWISYLVTSSILFIHNTWYMKTWQGIIFCATAKMIVICFLFIHFQHYKKGTWFRQNSWNKWISLTHCFSFPFKIPGNNYWQYKNFNRSPRYPLGRIFIPWKRQWRPFKNMLMIFSANVYFVNIEWFSVWDVIVYVTF